MSFKNDVQSPTQLLSSIKFLFFYILLAKRIRGLQKRRGRW